MFAQQIAASIPDASLSGCDHVARDLWRAYAAGALADPDVEALAAALEDRRRDLRGRGQERAAALPKPVQPRPTRFPPRRKQVSPDPARSRQRRRTLAASGALPPALACKFTTGELAVLSIVAAEVIDHGLCDRSLDEIAARAGTCRSLARRAIRLAARYRLLSIEYRPRPGRKSLTNILRVTDPAWRAWLLHRAHGRSPHGQKFSRRVGAGDTHAQSRSTRPLQPDRDEDFRLAGRQGGRRAHAYWQDCGQEPRSAQTPQDRQGRSG